MRMADGFCSLLIGFVNKRGAMPYVGEEEDNARSAPASTCRSATELR